MPTDEDWARAIEEYKVLGQTDDTVGALCEKYGIARPSFYLRLRREGIAPRKRKGAVLNNVDVRIVLEQLNSANQEIGRLKMQLLTKEIELDEAKTELAAARRRNRTRS